MTGTAAWILTAMGASNNGNATAGIGTGTDESSNGNETVAPLVILTIDMTGTAAWILTAMGASNNGNATAGIGIGTDESSNGNETVAPLVILTIDMTGTAIPNIAVSIGNLRAAEGSRIFKNAGAALLRPAFSVLDLLASTMPSRCASPCGSQQRRANCAMT
jgi:hypothetical protein